MAGLRREELALLAGVSTDYYQRMEQARDMRPSDQVLDALARALNFSAEESRHLHSLAAAARTPAQPARRYLPEQVPETTPRLLRTMTLPITPNRARGSARLVTLSDARTAADP